jgi:hypothetical protein
VCHALFSLASPCGWRSRFERTVRLAPRDCAGWRPSIVTAPWRWLPPPPRQYGRCANLQTKPRGGGYGCLFRLHHWLAGAAMLRGRAWSAACTFGDQPLRSSETRGTQPWIRATRAANPRAQRRSPLTVRAESSLPSMEPRRCDDVHGCEPLPKPRLPVRAVPIACTLINRGRRCEGLRGVASSRGGPGVSVGDGDGAAGHVERHQGHTECGRGAWGCAAPRLELNPIDPNVARPRSTDVLSIASSDMMRPWVPPGLDGPNTPSLSPSPSAQADCDSLSTWTNTTSRERAVPSRQAARCVSQARVVDTIPTAKLLWRATPVGHWTR